MTSTFPRRMWTYQKERFPLMAHGPIIAIFAACIHCVGSLVGAGCDLGTGLSTFAVLFLFFFQLRVADEFKDYDEDMRHRPYRPVPRGLVQLMELRALAVVAGAIQLALVASTQLTALPWLLAAWGWLGLMTVEFFAPVQLKARPVAYVLSHMWIMPMLVLLGTAMGGFLRMETLAATGWLALTAFCSGLVIEVGRKIRSPEEEEDGVSTYSAMLGPGRARTLLGALVALSFATAVLTVFYLTTFVTTAVVAALLLICLLPLLVHTSHGTPSRCGKRLETLSGVWTLVLYLAVGPLPLAITHLERV